MQQTLKLLKLPPSQSLESPNSRQSVSIKLQGRSPESFEENSFHQSPVAQVPLPPSAEGFSAWSILPPSYLQEGNLVTPLVSDCCSYLRQKVSEESSEKSWNELQVLGSCGKNIDLLVLRWGIKDTLDVAIRKLTKEKGENRIWIGKKDAKKMFFKEPSHQGSLKQTTTPNCLRDHLSVN